MRRSALPWGMGWGEASGHNTIERRITVSVMWRELKIFDY
jgi:hypothetical protein